MTQPLAKTNRALLEEISGSVHGVNQEHATLIATNRILAARLDTVLRDNEMLMRLVGRMTLDRHRLNAADERLEPEWANRRNA